MSRGEYADPKIAYNGILMNYWDVYDCMDEVEEPTDDDWLNAVSNLFDSYTYDVKNTDVDKFKMSDVMNVYRMVIIYQFTPLPTNNHKLYKYYL